MICNHDNQDWPYGRCRHCHIADHVVLTTILPIYNNLVTEAREFCRRVEAGQIHSRNTYAKMKALVAQADKAEDGWK